MSELIESATARGLGYLALAVLALVLLGRERSVARPGRSLWPTFWLISAILLVTMGIAQGTSLGDFVTELGRERARESGWYGDRRPLQAAVVGVVSAFWLTAVVGSVVFVPPRRRRYLPSVLAQLTLMCFAAVRMVSFHYVDAALYRRDIAGVRIAWLTEWLLLLANAVVIGWRLRTAPGEIDDELADRDPNSAPPLTTTNVG